jgi:hypothetical protein
MVIHGQLVDCRRLGHLATRDSFSAVGGALRRSFGLLENCLVDLVFARRWDPLSENRRVLLGLCR